VLNLCSNNLLQIIFSTDSLAAAQVSAKELPFTASKISVMRLTPLHAQSAGQQIEPKTRFEPEGDASL